MTIEYPASWWKDYELIDAGRGEKLERFGKYVLRRPEPKALWDPSLPESEWKRLSHVVFRPGAGFGKAGKEDSGTWEKLRGIDDQWSISYNGRQDPDTHAASDLHIALRLGQALSGAGKVDEAVAAFETAAKNGQEEMANKQISNLYLKKAVAALKGGKYADAASTALKATEYEENAQAYLIAGQASQKLGKNNDAISNFEKYLAAAPTAKNANAIAFTVAALYQKAGNKAKAVEFYKKVVNDPQLGAQAKQQLDALK